MSPNLFAAGFGMLVTVYFWWSNIKGIHESSGKALRIMQITTVMVVAFLIWCPITLLLQGHVQLPPAPVPANLQFSEDALGWFNGTIWPQIGAIAIIIAFGHSLLSMSGFETLAQVYREIAYPKLKNLQYTGNLVCIYAVFCTGVITLFAVMIIPDAVRGQYVDNLLGGLAMHLAGPPMLRLVFHIFVVIVGVLILSGAVNTSIIGANGVMNRVAEDGVLVDWFRKPHKRFGTTSRIINVIAGLQIVTIVLSRGDVYLLGEAYAFGVVWSFFLKSLGVLVLRYQRHDQEYKVPVNFRIGGVEMPVGLAATTLILFLVAIANLFSKQIATIYGVAFTIVVFVIFTISEQINKRRSHLEKGGLEEFNLDMQPEVTAETVHARPGCVLVAVRDYQPHGAPAARAGEDQPAAPRHRGDDGASRLHRRRGIRALRQAALFRLRKGTALARVVTMAEKEGKTVDLLVVPGVDPFDAMVQTAAKLKASRLVTGVSATMDSDELARRIGLAWERLPEPRHPFSLEIITPDRPSIYVNLGPHPPRLWPEDLDRVHDLWLRLQENFGSKLHHRDVVGVALRRLQKDLEGERKHEVLDDLGKDLPK